jgi:ferredoxin-thioredoxin reductase catalytic chain
VARLRRYLETYARKTGTSTHPDPEVTEAVLLGLAHHAETLGRPLCPCRFYPDAAAEVKNTPWICPCDAMRKYKYCHCLLFTGEEGLPITEHLPADHEGRKTYGLVKDPHPELGLERRAALP